MRLLVQEPMNTRSIGASVIGVPAVRPMYSSARSMRVALVAVGEARRDRERGR